LKLQAKNFADDSTAGPRAPLLRALPRVRDDFTDEQNSRARLLDARIVNPLIEREWGEWIDSHPQATVFHSSAWARVLVETYGHLPCYLRICAQGELVALVPLIEVQSLLTKSRGVCLPFTDYCAPLLFNVFSKAAVMDKIRQVARERKWSYFELRGDASVSGEATASESYYGHHLNLRPGGTALFAGFESSVQRAIRKAERSQLSVSVDSTPEAMDSFYRLHGRTRRRHGAPPQPRTFFAHIQQNIINAGLGFIVRVRSGQDVVAAAIFFRHKSNAIYKFGASDERVQGLRANNLAIWKAIEFLAESGVDTLHFGRTAIDNEGLRRFKRSWGAAEEPINYFKFDIATNTWVIPPKRDLQFHKEIFRALPVTINRLAGAMIYPHLD
jgi:lipid II:glycine glycyltransferase (peptidoglycan interpeptide bridge formation enzyme)